MDRMFREPVDEIKPEPEDNELPSGERRYEDNEIGGGYRRNFADAGPETLVRGVGASFGSPSGPQGGYPPGPAAPVPPVYAGMPQTQTPSRNNGALIVIAVLLALILVGGAVFGILYFKDRENKGGDVSENALGTVQEREDEATREAPAETQAAPAQEASTESAEITEEPSTAAEVTPSAVPQTAPPTTAPPTTIPLTTAAPTTAASAPAWLEPDPVVLTYGNSYMISYQTPGHAGVNLRQGPGDTYAKLAVLKEGAVLRYTGGKNGGYVSVDYFGTGSKQSGWVLEEYLINDSSGGELYPGFAPAPGVDLARISYATDSHAGLVLRAESTYYSEKLGVLPEGTVLYLLGGSANGYTQVKTQSGVVGWVLEDYLIK